MEFKGHSKAALELNIAPLIDVVFLLLIFFMLTSSMIQEEALKVTLPSSTSSQPIETKTFTVVIDKEGTYALDGSIVSLEDLQSKLTQSLLNAKDSNIILKSDSSVPVQTLVTVMDVIKDSGGDKISIATNR